MGDSAKKTKATATPLMGSTKTEKAAEVAKPTTTPRKGIELAAKVEAPKKTKAAAKPRKAATKKDSVGAISQPAVVSRESIEQLTFRSRSANCSASQQTSEAYSGLIRSQCSYKRA